MKKNKDEKRLQRSCEHERTEKEEVVFRNGTHHLRHTCLDCGKWLGWLPHPGALERAEETHQLIRALLQSPEMLTVGETKWLKKMTRKNTYPEWMREQVSKKYIKLLGGDSHE